MDTNDKYKLSTYKELSVFTENPSKKISVVTDETTNKLYIKKVLPGTEFYSFYVRLASLKHKNLIKIHDVICYEGNTYVFEEYINGQTLQELLKNEGSQPEHKVKEYILQILDVLIYLHSQAPPIIHRDVKPENIMLSADNVIKLLDFDIAREYKQSATRDTTFMGTKEYAAPEQYGYKQTDGRTDIYAIGVLLHEMLTGKLPQNNIAYNGSLHNVIEKCLRLDPKQRYKSVLALKKALLKTKFVGYKVIGVCAFFSILIIAIIILNIPKKSNSLDIPEDTVSSLPPTVEEQDSVDTDTLAETTNNSVKNVIEMPKIEADKVEDTITITSPDGKFTIDIPSNWEEGDPIAEDADLVASYENAMAYLSFYVDDKSEYDYDFEYTFEAWKGALYSVFKEDLIEPELVEEVKTQIDGRPAIQQTFSCIEEDVKVTALITYIDGEDYFGYIICASPDILYFHNVSTFEEITKSIKGL